ncbi:MAG: DUF444 family protein [Bacteroidales bacterium]|nr:DUF444 family protein [Bacteroidales bacterium]
MSKYLNHIFEKYLNRELSEQDKAVILNEMQACKNLEAIEQEYNKASSKTSFYDFHDLLAFQQFIPPGMDLISALKTLDELLEQDKKREEDGFPRRIRLGKLVRPSKTDKGKVVVVPSTTEPKFYHDDSVTEEEESGEGGAGEGEEGDVIGEQQAQPQPGEGEGQGAGEGDSSDHDVTSEAYDLGKIITEKFSLPNLKDKGKKRSFTKYTYDLTDRNRGFGQILDKKATLRRLVKTNIMLGRIKQNEPFSPDNMLLNPQDMVFRILSREKDFETQAVVFFLRDYSGSMQGDPTQLVTTQHLLIYSWLMYQYQNNVVTRFILHDTEAKEVPDFYTYYSSQVAGGTRVAPAFKLMNKIVEEEQLQVDYNIYVFYGTDGDDWDSDGKELIETLKQTLTFANRLGITVAKNAWTPDSKTTTVEKNIIDSGLLKERADLLKMDAMVATGVSEERIIEGIKKLVS